MIIHVAPEAFPETGGAEADTMKEAVSSGDTHEVELLFRELIQNSNDARNDPTSQIEVDIRISKWSNGQFDAMLKSLINIENSRLLSSLRKKLSKQPDIYALYFTDKNTKGLNGPTSARIQSKNRNFVNFFYKTGKSSDADQEGGGSKGHGRGVLFLHSQFGTTLTFSRFLVEGKARTRFYGMTIDQDFNKNGQNYTGRWFWGKKNITNPDLPVAFDNEEADLIAKQFDMFDLLSNSTGTVLCVISPFHISDSQSCEDYLKSMNYFAQKYIWPHLIRNVDGSQSIKLSLTNLKNEKSFPDVETADSPVNKYVEIYKSYLQKNPQGSLIPILSSNNSEIALRNNVFNIRTNEKLGMFNWIKRLKFDNSIISDANKNEYAEGASGIENTETDITGIAFFRSPKLVVTYYETQFKSPDSEIIGFFESSKSGNPFFSAAEDVTHDKWSKKKLQKILGPRRPNPVSKLESTIDDEIRSVITNEGSADHSSVNLKLGDNFGKVLSFFGAGTHKNRSNTKKPKSTSIANTPRRNNKNNEFPISIETFGDPTFLGEENGFAKAAWTTTITRNADIPFDKAMKITPIIQIQLDGYFENILPEVGMDTPTIESFYLGSEYNSSDFDKIISGELEPILESIISHEQIFIFDNTMISESRLLNVDVITPKNFNYTLDLKLTYVE